MGSRIDFGADELKQLGDLISRSVDSDYAEYLISFLTGVVPFDSSLLLIYHENRRPTLLFDGLRNPQRRNSASLYLEAAYLLDPFYQEALRQPQPALLRFSDLGDRGASFADYFTMYYGQSAVADEINFVLPIAPGRAVALSIERDADHAPFGDDEIARLKLLIPLVTSLILRMSENHQSDQINADQAHDRLQQRLSQFRCDILTTREREIVNLLLKGFSVSQIAESLTISVETVRVHRRNVYAKLSISSLAELFALAFDWVTDNTIR